MRDATAWDGDGVEKPLAELRSVLIPGETLEAWAIQRRIFALSHRRVLIAATSGRLVVLVRRLIAGFDVSTIRWQDLEEVTLRVGVIGADLTLRAGKATDLASLGAQGSQRVEFQGLRKEQARSEEHTSELQSRLHLVCRLLLEKKQLTFALSLED